MSLVVVRRCPNFVEMSADSYVEEGDSCVFDLMGDSKIRKTPWGLIGLVGDVEKFGTVFARVSFDLSLEVLKTRLLVTLEGNESDLSGLVVYKGAVFYMDSKGSLLLSRRDYAAIGYARDFAMGVMATESDRCPVVLASEHCNNVRGPFVTETYDFPT